MSGIDIGQLAEGDGVVDAIFGHVAIGGPLAAGDGEQAVGIDMEDVIAGERGGFALAFNQRAEANKHGQNVGASGRAD